jgi:hypothetical protein
VQQRSRGTDMHLSLAWRTGLAVYVLAVASVDGRIRFFDLEKLSQLGELDLLNAICTCMTSFNIKDLAGRGGGGRERDHRQPRPRRGYSGDICMGG